MFFVLFVFVFCFFIFFLFIYFILALCKKNNLGFFDTLQTNPDFSGTLQEYIQLDFSNFCYELYFREIEICVLFFLFSLLTISFFCCFLFTYFFNFYFFYLF